MRVSHAVERELRWYFMDSDGAIGLKTSYGAMIAGIQGVRGGAPITDIDERRLHSAERARIIARRLEQCDPIAREVLRAAFGVTSQISSYGILSHVMLLTEGFLRHWLKSGRRKDREGHLLVLFRRDSSPAEQLLASEIRREAEKLLHAAVKSYVVLEEGECSSRRHTPSQRWQRQQV